MLWRVAFNYPGSMLHRLPKIALSILNTHFILTLSAEKQL